MRALLRRNMEKNKSIPVIRRQMQHRKLHSALPIGLLLSKEMHGTSKPTTSITTTGNIFINAVTIAIVIPLRDGGSLSPHHGPLRGSPSHPPVLLGCRALLQQSH